jgi:hypothetical protein
VAIKENTLAQHTVKKSNIFLKMSITKPCKRSDFIALLTLFSGNPKVQCTLQNGS